MTIAGEKARMRTFLLIMVLGFALVGCAVPQPVGDKTFFQEEIAHLKRDHQKLSKQLEQIQGNLLLVEARVQDHQKIISELQGPPVAQKGTVVGEKTETATAEKYSTAPMEVQGDRTLSPSQIYLQARFQRSISGFEKFLEIYPDSDYACNAQYWLGECYYSQQQYTRAVEEFQKVADQYPQGSKTPQALLKMASALQQMNQAERAMDVLQILYRRYPDSSAARQSLKRDQPLENFKNKGIQ